MTDNELIAEFMELEWNSYERLKRNYDSNWNELMPVVIKAKELSFLVNNSIAPWIKAIRPVNRGLINADLQAIYKGVVSFIKWYNQQNSKHGNNDSKGA